MPRPFSLALALAALLLALASVKAAAYITSSPDAAPKQPTWNTTCANVTGDVDTIIPGPADPVKLYMCVDPITPQQPQVGLEPREPIKNNDDAFCQWHRLHPKPN